MTVVTIFGCLLPHGRDPALSVYLSNTRPWPDIRGMDTHIYISNPCNSWLTMLICEGSQDNGFLILALICLHVVIETVLTFYGMSFKGSNSLHSMIQPICMALLWVRPNSIVKRALDGRKKAWGLPLTDSDADLGLYRKEYALASFCEFCHLPWSFCSSMSFFPKA